MSRISNRISRSMVIAAIAVAAFSGPVAAATDYGSRLISCYGRMGGGWTYAAASHPTRLSGLNLTSGRDAQWIYYRVVASSTNKVFVGGWQHSLTVVAEGASAGVNWVTGAGGWANDGLVTLFETNSVGYVYWAGTYKVSLEVWYQTQSGAWYGPYPAPLTGPNTCVVR